MTDLIDVVEAYKREVSIPGAFSTDFPTVQDDQIAAALGDAFGEAQLDGFFGTMSLDVDSWSVRATLTPSPDWAIQASYAQIDEPEELHPGQDEHRFTASAHYANGRGLSAMLAFSNKDRVPGDSLTAWLAEANWDLDRHNTLFGRFENVANDELFPDHDDPLHDRKFRVSKFQAGYARRVPLGPFELALGGSIAAYAKPDALDAAYGDSPWGYTLFARLNLGG